jgi:hypothetical protein
MLITKKLEKNVDGGSGGKNKNKTKQIWIEWGKTILTLSHSHIQRQSISAFLSVSFPFSFSMPVSVPLCVCVLWSYCIFNFMSFFFGGLNSGFTLARQVLYCLSLQPFMSYFFFFPDGTGVLEFSWGPINYLKTFI